MARGGYREPQGAQPAAGPGKYSAREQPNSTTPSLDRPDIQSGDVQEIREGLKAAPIPEQATGGGPPRGRPSARDVRSAGRQMPSRLFDETQRPEEPLTAGLDFGAGPDSTALPMQPAPMDDREAVLLYLAGPPYHNQRALEMVQEMRQQRAEAPPTQFTPPDLPMPSEDEETMTADVDFSDPFAADDELEDPEFALEGEEEMGPVPEEAQDEAQAEPPTDVPVEGGGEAAEGAGAPAPSEGGEGS